MGAGVLLFNRAGELLIVKPSYKNHWSIPGGVVEVDESPKAGCIREVKEETGLDLPNLEFLCVDYCGANDVKNESLQFVFSGDVLSRKQISSIRVDGKEIIDYQFVQIKNLEKYLAKRKNLWRRLPKCLEALKKNTFVYLENGE